MNQNGETPPLLAGLFQDVAWIRVTGKGNFKTSNPLQAFANQMVGQGRKKFVVDLEECPTMDSTFMGTLTGIALRLNGSPDAKLQVINANERNVGLLRGMGIDHVLELDLDGEAWKEERELVRQNVTDFVESPEPSKCETAQQMLDAHEALCQANEGNIAKFKDVLDYLKKDLEDCDEAEDQ